jgi:hypothetical protein
MPLARESGNWEIPLTSDRLPQRLEAVFDLETAPTLTQLQLPIVSLGNWPVEETLLTIQAPETNRIYLDASSVDGEACDSARLASMIELTDLPEETAATSSVEELAAWYRPWARRLISCEERSSLIKLAGTDTANGGPSKLIRDKWRGSARRLQLEPVLQSVADEPPLASQPVEIWEKLNNSLPVTHYQWTGPKDPAEVRLTRPWRGGLNQITASAWIGVLLLAAVLLPSKAVVADIMLRWPHALGVALGLLWWLFCQPSAAGWLLISGSLIMGLRSAMQPAQRKTAG